MFYLFICLFPFQRIAEIMRFTNISTNCFLKLYEFVRGSDYPNLMIRYMERELKKELKLVKKIKEESDEIEMNKWIFYMNK